MKKTFITASLFFFLCNFSFAQKPVATYYDWNKIHPHEMYSVNDAGQKTGAYKEYDQSGIVIKEYNYLNGVENGLCIDYAATGNNQRVITAKATFKNGQAEGYFVEYCRYTDYKEKIQEGQYKNGKKNGIWKEWWCDDDSRGILKKVGSYNDDSQDGEWKTYSRNGTVLTKGSYANGFKKSGLWSYYSDKGNLISKGSFTDDKENGIWSYYDTGDSTKVLYSGEFSNGIKVGVWKIYFDKDWKETTDPNFFAYYRMLTFDNTGKPTAGKVQDFFISGQKQWEGYLASFNPDKYTGLCTWYYENGKVKEQQDYDKGDYKSYYENGNPEWTGQLKGGGKTGAWKQYFEDGKIRAESTYPTGKGKVYFKSGKINFEETYKNGLKSSYVKYNENGEVVSAAYVDPNENLDVDGQYGIHRVDKGGILDAKVSQMLNFILHSSNTDKFEFKLTQASNYFDGALQNVFFDLEQTLDGAASNGKFENATTEKHVNELKSAQTLFIQYQQANGIESKLKIENQIATLLEKVVE